MPEIDDIPRLYHWAGWVCGYPIRLIKCLYYLIVAFFVCLVVCLFPSKYKDLKVKPTDIIGSNK